MFGVVHSYHFIFFGVLDNVIIIILFPSPSSFVVNVYKIMVIVTVLFSIIKWSPLISVELKEIAQQQCNKNCITSS